MHSLILGNSFQINIILAFLNEQMFSLDILFALLEYQSRLLLEIKWPSDNKFKIIKKNRYRYR